MGGVTLGPLVGGALLAALSIVSSGVFAGFSYVGFRAELGVPVVADLGTGKDDPRACAVAMLRRSLAGLPAEATGPGAQVRVRMDAG